MKPRVVLMSCSDKEEGERLAKLIVKKRLASCVNIIPLVYSFFWWENKQQETQEAMLIAKSSEEKWEELMQFIKENHSYECPEIISFEPSQVFLPYLRWWEKELT
ncbi:cation tolerance protein CutA [Methylacidiphilum sp. Yel]|jgi:periplasmic divalent cation tolerance protein|uniref:divalent-cation tolerance protein CutA n=1 Tax=Methylacidiphilum sp. Yel TaxID=1847730 RepID=UPI00106C2F4B|nr:divalent-cation tolerance protein CutA [Methylacidiphilum sp. Yel]TFE70993.1 cation tolerance protein CutA [Methylacidiphilum sp. Yel]